MANEPAVRKEASEYLAPASDGYKPAVLVSGDYLASLDGELGDAIMEIKCPSSPRSGALQDGVYLSHWWQMQHQLMVSGAKRCHYVCAPSRRRRTDLQDSCCLSQMLLRNYAQHGTLFWQGIHGVRRIRINRISADSR